MHRNIRPVAVDVNFRNFNRARSKISALSPLISLIYIRFIRSSLNVLQNSCWTFRPRVKLLISGQILKLRLKLRWERKKIPRAGFMFLLPDENNHMKAHFSSFVVYRGLASGRFIKATLGHLLFSALSNFIKSNF